MLKKSITLFASALLFVVIGASSSKAQEVNLGGFTGNIDTIVTSLLSKSGLSDELLDVDDENLMLE